MELLDVLDQNGNKTGVVKSYDDVHRDGDWHAVVHVFIVNTQGQVLLQRRSAKKSVFPNLWSSAASGHVKAGEEPKDTVFREIKEELGLDLSDAKFNLAFTDLNTLTKNNNQIDYVYLVLDDSIDLNNLVVDPDEASEVKWFELDEFEQAKKGRHAEHIPKPDHFNDQLFRGIRELLQHTS